MHFYLAEIMTKARLHEGTRGGIKRLARCMQDLMHDRWNRRNVPKSEFRVSSFALKPLLATFFALAGWAGSAAAGAFALEQATPVRGQGGRRLCAGSRES
jgi:hypothetical protein